MDIEIRELSKTFTSRTGDDVIALQGLSTTVTGGEFVSLVGPSGCGKSTLLNILAGLSPRTSGDVMFNGQLTGPDDMTRQVGLVFQKSVLFPWRTALENVYLPAQVGRRPIERDRGTELRTRARELLELVSLSPFAEKYPWELSGGMQQRVAIARALLLETEVLCLDEPFASLDEFTREQMHLELLRIWREQGFTGIFVTHNIFEGTFLSDRVLVMTPRPGKVVADVAIDLPRPRTSEMIGTSGFTDNVRRVRDAMAEYWQQ